MENLNINPRDAITAMAKEIERTNSSTKILAASFKMYLRSIQHANVVHKQLRWASILLRVHSMPSVQKQLTILPMIGNPFTEWVQQSLI